MKKLTECDGMKYTAKIYGTKCEGKVTVEGGMVFLCQNEKDGHSCKDKKGYLYSWSVYDGTAGQVLGQNVTDFTLRSENPETYKDWQVGDNLKCNGRDNNYEVMFRSGDMVVCKTQGEATGNFTCDELFSLGFRLIATPAEPEVTELTLEQVAALAGVDVKTLRIKDK